MNSIYNDYNFQKNHCKEGKFFKSNIKGFLHSTKIKNTKINNTFYCETAWGYSFPKIDSEYEIKTIWREWSLLCKNKNIIAELIKIPPFFTFDNCYSAIFEEIHIVSKTCALELKDENFSMDFNKKTRYIIRKSENNLIYRKALFSDLKLIYDLYIESMNKLNAEKRFFLDVNTFEFLMKNKKSEFYLAFSDNKLISFVCFLFDKSVSHYHLSASSSLGRGLNANYLLLYKAIMDSLNKDIKMIHYGGGLTNQDKDPLFKFKSKFSNKFLDYKIGLSVHNKDLFEKLSDRNSDNILGLA